MGVQQADRCKCKLVYFYRHDLAHPYLFSFFLFFYFVTILAKELTNSKARKEDYEQIDKSNPEISKRIRGEVTRFQRRNPLLEGKHYLERFENVLLAYLNANRDVEYHPAMVSMCAPFIYVLETECDAYHCFERLMQALGNVDSPRYHFLFSVVRGISCSYPLLF